MKITAQFESTEELFDFAIKLGGAAGQFKPIDGQVIKKEKVTKKTESADKKVEAKETSKINEVKEATKKDKVEDTVTPQQTENTSTITKEVLRARLNEIIKAGKQTEVKELVAKFGAKKLPDVDPKDFEALYKEAEALL